MANQNQIDFIHIEVENIMRYLNEEINKDNARNKIYKQIRELTETNIGDLTDPQFNIVMHHLRKLEQIMHVYHWARAKIERELIRRLMDSPVKLRDYEYENPSISLEAFEKVTKKADAIININKLMSFFEK